MELSGIERELAADGHTNVTTAKVDGLNHKSAGAYELPGVGLGTRTDKGSHISLLVSTSGNLRLKKGMQFIIQTISRRFDLIPSSDNPQHAYKSRNRLDAR
jgi:hypothetical protein